MNETFRLDTTALAKSCQAANATNVQKGLLLSIFILCWESDKRGSSQMTAKALADNLGCEEQDLTDLLSLFAPDKWLAEEFCLESLELIVTSPYLLEEHKSNLAIIEEKNKETKKAKKERQIAEASLVKLIKSESDEPLVPTIAYLKHEDRCTQVYQGWLPTNRFNQSGQVYCVTEELMKELKNEFPFADINGCILAMHGWLSRNSTKRKTLAKMPEFIRFWIMNSTNGANTKDSSVDFDAIEQQLEKMFR